MIATSGKEFRVPRLVRAVRVILLLVAAVVVFLCAITLAYTVPNGPIVSHARSAADLLEAEGLRPTLFGFSGPILDNFTDAVMIDTAIANKHVGALTNALSSKRQGGSWGPIIGLRDTAKGHMSTRYSYARYWHGYQVVLRPMLFLFDYGQIRYLNMLVLSVLAFLTCISVRRSLGWSGLVAFAAALMLGGFYVVPLSLQFSSVTYLMLLGVFAALELERRELLDVVFWEFFAVIGALTSFLDLLTAPLLTLGMPLAAILLVRARNREVPIRTAALTSFTGASWWGVGFASSWAAKWIIASALLRIDVTADALSSASDRTGLTELGHPIAQAVLLNVGRLFPLMPTDMRKGIPTLVFLAVVTLGVAVSLFKVMRDRSQRGGVGIGDTMKRRASALILAPLPFGWLIVLSQHSAIHFWYTYRILAIALFVVFGVVLAGIDTEAEQPQTQPCLPAPPAGRSVPDQEPTSAT